MGWTVLYIAFGIVALWLLGEVLLQYKARLRWRLVAFCGFLGVVIGVVLSHVPLIAVGAVAFATGQTFVTLSFRRGFSTGWALGGKPGTSRRRREGAGGVRPLPAVSDGSVDEAVDEADVPPPPPDAPGVVPEAPGVPPMPDETPADGFAAYAGDGGEIYGDQARDTGDVYPDPYATTAAGYGSYQGDYPAETPAWGTPRQDYGAEPYAPEHQQYAATYAADYAADYSGSPAPADEHAGAPWPAASDTYYQETPPGGVWVPQQRESPVPDLPDPGYGYPQQPQQQPPQQPQAQDYPGHDAYGPSAGQGYYYSDDQRY
ncbi:hypothetical protein [Streptomyces radicis]|uniref:Uncharacterized protein n=1 Tax=Streptomyces radicis TaxID=1750517 RepID=A0A3A9VZF5_9ACTN|nr:hypothetical protein [Streptomyces radicis]RKN06120.1 hypothetical protein D7319_23190 [Streptomyces radicis]RKN18490.1 hypothetical protein D7318_22050 [Streptomyces radicis]